MDTTPLPKALTGHRLFGLDACVLIYHLEGHEEFGRTAGEVLDEIERGRAQAVLSTLALTEVQVGPYRRRRAELADYYYAALHALPNVRWQPLTYEIADLAGQLRAEYGASTPDAIHLATAVHSGASLFVTNDRTLPAMPGLTYALLSD